MKKKIKLTVIPYDKSIELTISGTFYQRLNKFLVDYSANLSKAKFTASIVKIKKGLTENDSDAYNLETLIILLKDIEDTFKKAELTTEDEVEVDDIDTIRNSEKTN